MSSRFVLSWPAFAVLRGAADIVLRYEGGTLGFERGLGIAGRSGSGKSLFARALVGMLPVGLSGTSAPILARSAGAGETAPILPKNIVYVPQSPASALPAAISCTGLLEEVIRWSGGTQRFPASPANCFKRVGLDPQTVGLLHASQLSGGMAQRFAIALAIAREPCAIVLDEPTVGLDASAVRMLLSVMDSLMEDGIALITVTHDDRAGSIADQWVELERKGSRSTFQQAREKGR